MSNPWLKFYTTDWRADPRLKMCSMAARGLWIEMICLMHEATPYGHLLVSGQCPTDAQLAVLVGAPPEQITALLGELESAGVFSRTKEGVIYSRKLSRMAKKAATARNNGRKGGNPSLSKQRQNPASVKGSDKDRDKPQKPEARIQNTPKSPPEGGFDDFWKVCPKKVGKGAAERAYAKAAKKADPSQIEAGMKRYAAQVSSKDPQYIAHPSTWLNQRRWEDEEPQTKTSDAQSEHWRKLAQG